MTHLEASKIERVRDASGSDGGRVDVVDCGPFPAGKLNLDCEAPLPFTGATYRLSAGQLDLHGESFQRMTVVFSGTLENYAFFNQGE